MHVYVYVLMHVSVCNAQFLRTQELVLNFIMVHIFTLHTHTHTHTHTPACAHRYVKRVINWCRYRGERKDDIYTRWEKDFDLIAIAEHGLFFEYLELGAPLFNIQCSTVLRKV